MLIFDHFLHLGFFDFILKSFIVDNDILLQFGHEILDSNQESLHGCTVLVQNLLAFSLQGRLLLFTVSLVGLDLYKSQVSDAVHGWNNLLKSL